LNYDTDYVIGELIV